MNGLQGDCTSYNSPQTTGQTNEPLLHLPHMIRRHLEVSPKKAVSLVFFHHYVCFDRSNSQSTGTNLPRTAYIPAPRPRRYFQHVNQLRCQKSDHVSKHYLNREPLFPPPWPNIWEYMNVLGVESGMRDMPPRSFSTVCSLTMDQIIPYNGNISMLLL